MVYPIIGELDERRVERLPVREIDWSLLGELGKNYSQDSRVLVYLDFLSSRDVDLLLELSSRHHGDSVLVFKASNLPGPRNTLGQLFKGVVGVYGRVDEVLELLSGNLPVSGIEVFEIGLGYGSLYNLLVSRLPKPIRILVSEPVRIIKFGLVGLTGFIVNLLVSGLFYYLGILNPYYSTLAGFEASTVWNFALHEHWTFRDLSSRSVSPAFYRLLKFHVASVGSLVTQIACVHLGNVVLGFNYTLSLAAGIILGFLVNYVVSRFYAWRS
ncbi:GtrA family protein [Thermogladius sp. 4427co]|uniref:GtrA family protein n=1 Tax=Thermogladius sp. 4427co TaxID=3450718 RepID=UPI003F79EAE5